MRHTTLVPFALFALSSHVGSTFAGEPNRAPVVQDGDRVTVTTDIFVNSVFTDEEATRVREQATQRGLDPDATVAQARQAPLQARCKLWVTYLERQAGQTREVQLQRDTVRCVEDTRQSGVDGRTRRGRLLVSLKVPANQTVVEARTVPFRGRDRYSVWETCHRAAAKTTAVAAVCVEEPQARADQQITTNLRVFQFAR